MGKILLFVFCILGFALKNVFLWSILFLVKKTLKLRRTISSLQGCAICPTYFILDINQRVLEMSVRAKVLWEKFCYIYFMRETLERRRKTLYFLVHTAFVVVCLGLWAAILGLFFSVEFFMVTRNEVFFPQEKKITIHTEWKPQGNCWKWKDEKQAIVI